MTVGSCTGAGVKVEEGAARKGQQWGLEKLQRQETDSPRSFQKDPACPHLDVSPGGPMLDGV